MENCAKNLKQWDFIEFYESVLFIVALKLRRQEQALLKLGILQIPIITKKNRTSKFVETVNKVAIGTKF